MSVDSMPLKRLASFHNHVLMEERPLLALEHLESWTGGMVCGVELGRAEPGAAGAAVVEPGDVLFGKLRPYLAKGITITEPLAASTELICMRPQPDVDPRWLGYVTRSQRFVEWSVATSEGTKMPRTSWEKLGAFEVAKPPLAEQRAIADYLDAETARIDALIAKKQQLIQLLEERFLARVDDVCSGDDVVLRRVIARFVDYRGATPEKTDQGVPLLTAAHIKGGAVDHSLEPVFVSDAVYESWMRRGFPTRGDVLLTMEAPLGEVAQITEARVALAQRLMLLKTDANRCTPDYLAFALRSTRMQDRLRAYATGSTALGIKADRLKGLHVPIPSLIRQAAIVTVLRDDERTKTRAVRLLSKQLALLFEHRQALIGAAVSGG